MTEPILTARGLVAEKQNLQQSEQITVVTFDVPAIRRMLINGEIEDGKTIAHGVDRVPEPAFGHHGGSVRAVEVGDESEVLVLQKLSFRQGGLHHLALFDDLF